MKLSLDLRATLTQTLTPQQIQYLKLLQLPVVQLEQHVLQEIEQNPMLEESIEPDSVADIPSSYEDSDFFETEKVEAFSENGDSTYETGEYEPEYERFNVTDQAEPFEYYKDLWPDEPEAYKFQKSDSQFDDDDSEPYQIKDTSTFAEDLLEQLRMLELSEEEFFIAQQIIWNLDSDGYLRHELTEIVEETNTYINELNYELEDKSLKERIKFLKDSEYDNPARNLALSRDSKHLLNQVYSEHPELAKKNQDLSELIHSYNETSGNGYKMFNEVTISQAEKMLAVIQQLDPPGIGSRNIQECLVAQLKIIKKPNPSQKLALDILQKTYDAFTKKHFHIIAKQLSVSDDEIREALEVIRKLNPKPGGDDDTATLNTVMPDFIIGRDDETNELIITINDHHLPQIRLNQAYDRLKKQVQYRQSNKETKDWIRAKYEDAKFLIQALKQRKTTMLKVMTAIAHIQQEFFYDGPSALKPLIYKTVSEKTGLDISTVCRIVNGKYVQTEFGTFELKFFFSESLPTDEGEEVSTKVIRQFLKEIIDTESKKKPYSDDKIARVLKEKGYNVARRTVAKYREQMKIPVARLRREL